MIKGLEIDRATMLFKRFIQGVFERVEGLDKARTVYYLRLIYWIIWIICILLYVVYFVVVDEYMDTYTFGQFLILMPSVSCGLILAYVMPLEKQYIPYICLMAGAYGVCVINVFYGDMRFLSYMLPITAFALLPTLSLLSLFPKPMLAMSLLYWCGVGGVYYLYVNPDATAQIAWLLSNMIVLLAIAISVIIRNIMNDWGRALISRERRIQKLTETNTLLDISLSANQFGLVGYDKDGDMVIERGLGWGDIADDGGFSPKWGTLEFLNAFLESHTALKIEDFRDEFHEIQIGERFFLARTYNLDNLTIFSFFETTFSRRVEEELRVRQKLSVVGEITTGVAHNYNNTLAIATSNLEAFPKNEAPLLWAQYVQPSIEAIEQSTEISRKLLTLAGRQNLKMQVFDAGKALGEFEPLIRSALGANIELQIETQKHAYIQTDIHEFESAILNLTINSKNAAPKRRAKIKLSVANSDEYVVVSVVDNGHGIDPAIMDKIFDPFFSTRESQFSTGLGLSTVKGFVEQSHGYVDLSSNPSGTIFKLHFPKSRAVSLQKTKKFKPNPPTDPGSNQSRYVLLVDDNAQVVESLSRLIESQGYQTICETSPQDCLNNIRSHADISHAFLDLSMPEMDGIELRLKLGEYYPDTDFYLLTGEIPSARIKEAEQAQFVDVLIKPVRAKTIFEILGADVENSNIQSISA